jgi:hypothetical protein
MDAMSKVMNMPTPLKNVLEDPGSEVTEREESMNVSFPSLVQWVEADQVDVDQKPGVLSIVLGSENTWKRRRVTGHENGDI